MADTRPGQSPATYLSERGHLVIDRERQRVDVVLDNGSQHLIGGPSDYTATRFKRRVLSVPPSPLFAAGGYPRGDNEMTIAELQAEVRKKVASGQSPHNEIMYMHQKFAFPVACLVFGLLALSLGVSNSKDSKHASFVVGLAVVFVFYALMMIAQALAK